MLLKNFFALARSVSLLFILSLTAPAAAATTVSLVNYHPVPVHTARIPLNADLIRAELGVGAGVPLSAEDTSGTPIPLLSKTEGTVETLLLYTSIPANSRRDVIIDTAAGWTPEADVAEASWNEGTGVGYLSNGTLQVRHEGRRVYLEYGNPSTTQGTNGDRRLLANLYFECYFDTENRGVLSTERAQALGLPHFSTRSSTLDTGAAWMENGAAVLELSKHTTGIGADLPVTESFRLHPDQPVLEYRVSIENIGSQTRWVAKAGDKVTAQWGNVLNGDRTLYLPTNPNNPSYFPLDSTVSEKPRWWDDKAWGSIYQPFDHGFGVSTLTRVSGPWHLNTRWNFSTWNFALDAVAPAPNGATPFSIDPGETVEVGQYFVAYPPEVHVESEMAGAFGILTSGGSTSVPSPAAVYLGKAAMKGSPFRLFQADMQSDALWNVVEGFLTQSNGTSRLEVGSGQTQAAADWALSMDMDQDSLIQIDLDQLSGGGRVEMYVRSLAGSDVAVGEDFNQWSSGNQIFHNGSSETIQQSGPTGFPWGGWAPNSGGFQAIGYQENRNALNFTPGALESGAYCYTIFDSTGGNTPDSQIVNFHRVTIRTEQGGNPAPDVDVRLLVRDANGDWYLSTAATKVPLPAAGKYSFSVGDFDWEQVTGAGATDMNEMDDGAGPGPLTTNTGSIAPDFSELTGGGIYIETVNVDGPMEFSEIRWLGRTTSSGTPRPVLFTNRAGTYQADVGAITGWSGRRDFALEMRVAGGEGEWAEFSRLNIGAPMPEAPALLAPVQDSDVTDVAVEFLWYSSNPAGAYELQYGQDETLSSPQTINVASFVTVENVLSPELLATGDWYWRVRSLDPFGRASEWTDIWHFTVNDEHPIVSPIRPVTPDEPLFVQEAWDIPSLAPFANTIPEDMKPYTVMRVRWPDDLAGGYMEWLEPARDNDILVMLGSTANEEGYGASLAEVERAFQMYPNVIGMAGGELMWGFDARNQGENERFRRMMRLCAKYGRYFLWGDGNGSQMRWQQISSEGDWPDFLRAHSENLIFMYKTNISPVGFTAMGTLQGMWLDDMLGTLGWWHEAWYWDHAGFHELDVYLGQRQGDNSKMPAVFWNMSWLLGLSQGATVFSVEGQGDSTIRGTYDPATHTDIQAIWDHEGNRTHVYDNIILPFQRAVLEQDLLLTKDQVAQNIHVAVRQDVPPEYANHQGTYGDYFTLYDETYGFRTEGEVYELIPNTGQYNFFPLLPHGVDSLPDKLDLPADITYPALSDLQTPADVQSVFDTRYTKQYTGDAFVQVLADTVIVMSTYENWDVTESYSIPFASGTITNMAGDVGPHKYMIGKFHDGGTKLWLQVHTQYSQRATNLVFDCDYEPQLTVMPAAALASSGWNSGQFTVELTHGDLPVEIELVSRSEFVAPVASFDAVTPSLRNQRVDTLTLNFSEDVTGVDLSDFHGMIDGQPFDLATSGVTVTEVAADRYELDLASVDAPDGDYEIQFRAENSDVRDLAGNPSASDASVGWTLDTVEPQVSYEVVYLNEPEGLADKVVFNFTEPVIGFALEDLSFTRNGQPVDIFDQAFAVLSAGQYSLSLEEVTGGWIGWTLTLDASEAGISDYAGNPLTMDVVIVTTPSSSTNWWMLD